MLLDVTKTQALKLKKLIGETDSNQIDIENYRCFGVAFSVMGDGTNVALTPVYANKDEKIIVFSMVAIASYGSNMFTGVVSATPEESKPQYAYSGTNGYYHEVKVNELFTIIKDNNYSVGTNLTKALTTTSTADYWLVCYIGGGYALLKNNASGGGGGNIKTVVESLGETETLVVKNISTSQSTYIKEILSGGGEASSTITYISEVTFSGSTMAIHYSTLNITRDTLSGGIGFTTGNVIGSINHQTTQVYGP